MVIVVLLCAMIWVFRLLCVMVVVVLLCVRVGVLLCVMVGKLVRLCGRVSSTHKTDHFQKNSR